MEWLGFLISILALIWITYKQHAAKQGQSATHEEKSEEDEAFDQLMKIIKVREERQAPPPKPVKLPKQQRKEAKSTLEKRQLKSNLDERKLISPLYREDEKEGRRPARAELAVRRLANRRDLLIYQEIIGKPRAVMDDGHHCSL